MIYSTVRIFDNFNSSHFHHAFQELEADPNSITQSAPTNTKGACGVPFVLIWLLTQFCMVAQLDPRDWYIKKQKLLYKADNYIGRKKCHYMLYVMK